MGFISASSAAAATNLRVLFSRLRTRLIRLYRDGPASTSELADAEHVRSQSMTATLTGLDRLGYLARSPDPDDGRRQVITLTESGRARATHRRHVRQEWLAEAIQHHYTEAERHVINEALTLLDRLTE